MADGATKDYKFGQKNNWRRAMWNEVLRRTAGREKTQPILYLAGPDDLDREVAVSKGVPPHNLIAIDRSRHNVSGVREHRGIAIHGDALECLLSWPLNRPACAVLLDFCCGLDQMVMTKVYEAICRNSSLRGAVFMVNFQRGRDASTNGFRKGLSDLQVQNLVYKGVEFQTRKHRAVQFVLAKAFDQARKRVEDPEPHYDADRDVALRVYAAAGGSDYISLLNFYLRNIIGRTKPAFWSYRSGPLVFDSSVFEPIQFDQVAFEQGMVSRGHRLNAVRSHLRRFADAAMARKISAAMAIRTMRQNAGLK